MQEIHFQRLLNVARALRESPKPDAFCMDIVMHGCGTPACAIGHYVWRTDLQKSFAPIPGKELCFTAFGSESPAYYCSFEVLKHFDITQAESEELFAGPEDESDDYDEDGMPIPVNPGCGGAKTALEAAEYIESFVARKRAEAA